MPVLSFGRVAYLKIRTCVWVVLLAAGGTCVGAVCPAEEKILKRLENVDLESAARTARFSAQVPVALYKKAARRPGQPFADHRGSRGFAVLIAAQPIEVLWKAINDEDHHDLGEGYLPLRHSEVIGGTPNGASRFLFQTFKEMGVGRWWVSQVRMSRELYHASAGQLWEVVWEDRMKDVDPTRPPLKAASAELQPIRASRGAWLLVPLTSGCTAVEHFSWSEPGGLAGALQPLLLRRALRRTVSGLARLASEHVATPHPGVRFIRPDGTALD